MRRIKLLSIWMSLSLFWTAQAFALGLGDIEVKSGLNQPLNAEIEVLSVQPDEVDKIKITLADEIAYVTSGVDRIPLLSELVFAVEQRSSNRVFIKVTTVQPIREPFLDFIIEANWPTGRLFREYTLLLDPPVFAGETATPTQAPTAERQTKSISELISGSAPTGALTQRQTKSISDLMAAPAPSASRQTSARTATQAQEVRVQPNQTLWDIAEETRNGNSIEQVMMALYDKNPNAFFDRNINNLKAGYVMRVPDQAEIEQRTGSQAAREARQHYKQWLASRRMRDAATAKGVGTDAGLAARSDSVSAGAADAGAGDAQLRLASPEDGAAVGGLGSGGSGVSDSDMAIVERISGGERAALEAEIASLEEQLSMMERLVTLKDDQLVELQRKLGSDVDTMPLATDEIATAADDTMVEPLPAGDAASPDVVADSATVVAKETQQAAQQPQEQSWLDLLADPKIVAAVLGFVVLIGAVVWTAVRKRRESTQEEFDLAYSQVQDEMKIPSADEVGFDEQAVQEEPDFASVDDLSGGGFDTLEADEAEIDPIAEADVYLAYRRFQQAEELIKEALEAQPARQDLQLKMLEIYFGAGNKEGFEAQAEALYAMLGGEESDVWDKVLEMGHDLCPDHPLFGAAAAQAGLGGMAVEAGTADLDLGHTEGGAPDFSEMTGEAATGPSLDDAGAADEFAAMMESSEQSGAGEFNMPSLESDLNAMADELNAYSQPAGVDDQASAEGDSANLLDFESGLASGAQFVESKNEGPGDVAVPLETEQSGDADSSLDFNLDSFTLDEQLSEADTPASADAVASLSDGVAGQDNSVVDFQSVESVASVPPEAQDESAQMGELEEVFTGLDEGDIGGEGDDLFAGTDMVGTKLDLARAYIDMDDRDGARGILQEVIQEGSEDQRQEAQELMQKIG